MTQTHTQYYVNADIVIIGGGIAGLWTLNTLTQQGYQVILLENQRLGSGQTIKSQGIIHGGLKYALSGLLNKDTEALKAMPKLWQACLAGHGSIKLAQTQILSKQQYLWSSNSLSNKLKNFFASKALVSRMQTVPKRQQPELFQHPQFTGNVYQLDEVVLDIPSLLRDLSQPHGSQLIKVDETPEYHYEFDDAQNCTGLIAHVNKIPVQFNAGAFIHTSGNHNTSLSKQLTSPAMQQRPLHMTWLRAPRLPQLFGHCLSSYSNTPAITITTHKSKDGQDVWYLGGQLAESGVTRSANNQITTAQALLNKLFPWVDCSQADWGSFFVNRAEAKQPNGAKPDNITYHTHKNILTAWPTKLAFAPHLATSIANFINSLQFTKQTKILESAQFPSPMIAQPIWDENL